MKRAKKSPRRKLVSEADRVFSLWIRNRDNKQYGHCVFCKKPIEHCFHFITRAKYSVRWDELNCTSSCRSCNYSMEYNPHPFIKWFLDKHGLATYEALILKSNQIAKFSTEDLQGIIEKYNEK